MENTFQQTRFESYVPTKISVRSKDKIDRKLMGLFINDLQPLSVVDDDGFKEFVYALNPGYQLPSRFSVSKTLLPAMYEECVNNVQQLINCGKAFCITTDAWTSINTVSFIGVTAHFLDKNFTLHSILLECSSFDLRHSRKFGSGFAKSM